MLPLTIKYLNFIDFKQLVNKTTYEGPEAMSRSYISTISSSGEMNNLFSAMLIGTINFTISFL